jgi:hypothetical protein
LPWKKRLAQPEWAAAAKPAAAEAERNRRREGRPEEAWGRGMASIIIAGVKVSRAARGAIMYR